MAAEGVDAAGGMSGTRRLPETLQTAAEALTAALYLRVRVTASPVSRRRGRHGRPLPSGEVDRELFASPPGGVSTALSLRERRT